MLARRQRIPRGVRLERGRKVTTPYFVMRSAPNSLSFDRFRVIIGLRVDKRAVVRHRLKRKLLSALIKIPASGTDYVLTVLPTAKTAGAHLLRNTIRAMNANK